MSGTHSSSTEAGVQRAVDRITADPNWAANLSDPNDAFSADKVLGAGTYTVVVTVDDPQPGQIRVRSTGDVGGLRSASASVEVIIQAETIDYPDIFDYALFGCGNLHLNSGSNQLSDGDVFVGGNFDMQTDTNILNGDVSVMGNFNMSAGQVMGDVTANGNASVNSSASPAVDGDVRAGGNVSGSGQVTGSTTGNISPDPVTDLCAPAPLADLAITSDQIQDYRDNADTTISGNYDVNGGAVAYTGVVHVTGNMSVTGDVTLSGNVIFVVDGNVHIDGPGSIKSSPSGSTVTFMVPSGNMHVQGGGNVEIDGAIQLGEVGSGGVNGGNLHVQGGSNLAVNGSVSALDGNTHFQGGSTVTINNVDPVDSNLAVGGTTGPAMTLNWSEVSSVPALVE